MHFRRATWLVVATVAFWIAALGVWLLVPSSFAADDRNVYMEHVAHNTQLAWGILAATSTTSAAVVVWMLTSPPNGRPPS